MTTAHGPIVGRRRLRFALRQAREAAELTQEQVAAQMDWSLSKLIRIEAGTVSVSTNDLKALLALYRITDGTQVEELVELARASRQRTWLAGYKDQLASYRVSFIGLEAETSTLSSFNPLLVPGLLQTETYARAVIAELASHEDTPEPVEPLVDVRMRRQHEVLGRRVPPRLLVLMDEAVLRRPVGGWRAMREQLAHLVEAAEQPNISLRILPFSAGPYPAMYGPFTILDFPEEADTPVVFLENAFSGDVIERAEEVSAYRGMFDQMWHRALTEESSAELIKELIKRIAERVG
jgi:transcriptional regulator with XRE-family HTH domain